MLTGLALGVARITASLTINDRTLTDDVQEVIKHIARLWGFGVQLESVDKHGKVVQHWEAQPQA